MGLDAVELVMEVEDEFGFQIPDEDAEKLATVGDLHAYVVARLRAEQRPLTPNGCPTAMAFYRMRRALVRYAGVPRQAIRPSTPIEAVLPAAKRRALWPVLNRESGLSWPQLQRPFWLVFATAAIVAVIIPWRWWYASDMIAIAFFAHPFSLAISLAILGAVLAMATTLGRPPAGLREPG